MLFSGPGLEEKIVRLIEIIENALAKVEWKKLSTEHPEADERLIKDYKKRLQQTRAGNDLQRAYEVLHNGMLDFASDPELYECWMIVRKIDRYRKDFHWAYGIFEKAYVEHSTGEEKPLVNLVEAFADLAHDRFTLKEVGDKIRRGHYRLKSGDKMIHDPLLTTREKAIRNKYRSLHR